MKNIQEIFDIRLISGNITTNSFTGNTSTNTTIWKGGYVSDNFHSYYLDENMIKHYCQ